MKLKRGLEKRPLPAPTPFDSRMLDAAARMALMPMPRKRMAPPSEEELAARDACDKRASAWAKKGGII